MALDSLNPDQKKAVIITESNLLVSACPGSGKTRLLQEKAEYILKKDPKATIIAVTFTKDSANELLKRISSVVGDQSHRVKTGTFHSLAQQQLKKIGRRINLITGGSRFHLIERLWSQYAHHVELDDVLSAIEDYKSRVITNYKDLPDCEETSIFLRYQENLKKHNMVDFSDLIVDSVNGMLDKTIKPYNSTYMFVDEFQDVDRIQYAWVQEHAKNGTKITAVGDEDQSIYAFRNAMGYEGMVNFEKDFKAKKVLLGMNYRSHAEILAAAGSMIQNNSSRNEKQFFAHKGVGGSVEYREYFTRVDEMHGIVDTIGNDTKNFGNWAILTRTNKGMDRIEADFSSYGIPYERHGGTTIWKKPIVEHYTNFLKELELGKGGFATIQLLTWAGLEEEDVNKIQKAYNGKLETLFDSHSNVPDIKLIGGAKKIFSDFVKQVPIWISAIKNKRYEIPIFSVMDWMKHQKCRAAEERLLEVASNALARLIKLPISQRVRIVDSTRKKNKNKDKVNLYTIHKSKGLEFKYVWMAGVEEKTLPHEDSPIDEERRLAYVGITRAEEKIILSSVKTRATPSRFLAEAGLVSS